MSKGSSGKATSTVDEHKTGPLERASSLIGAASRGNPRSASRRMSNRKGHGRIRALSSSELSSSKGTDHVESGNASDNDSWAGSHDMKMIDEADLSEEGDDFSDEANM